MTAASPPPPSDPTPGRDAEAWLLLDLDGVLRTWDPAVVAAIEARHGVVPGSLARAAFGTGSRLVDAVTGRISDEEWRADVVRLLVPVAGDAARQVVEEWSAGAGAVDPDVLAVVRDARATGWRVGLLTNATTRLDADLAVLGLDAEVDRVLNTSTLGVAKPEPAVFAEACRRLGATPSRVVFVDDTAVNVAAGQAAGLRAHLHRDAPTLARLVAAEGAALGVGPVPTPG